MAVNDPTTNYDWDLPVDGGSTDAWGTLLNEALGEALDSVDADIAAVQTDLDTLESDIDDLEERIEGLEAEGNHPVWARVSLSANQSVSKDSDTTLTWDVEEVDHGNLFDSGSPSRLTIPVANQGLFEIRAVVRVPAFTGAGDDGFEWTVTLLKNGIPVAFARVPYTNDGHHDEDTGEQVIKVATLDEADPEDYYEVRVHYDYHDLGDDPISVLASSSYFEVVAIHAVRTTSDLPTAPDLHVAARFVTTRADGEQLVTGDIVDQSVNAYACQTVQGTITWDEEFPTLNDQPAFEYSPGANSTTTYVEMLTEGEVDINGDCTVFVVLDPADDTGSVNRDIINDGNPNGDPSTRWWKEGDAGGNDVNRVFRTGGGDEKGTGRYGNLGIMRIESGTVAFWVDGTKETLSTVPSDAGDPTSTQNIVIGGHRTDSSNGDAFSRRIAEIVVYNRALSDSEVDEVEAFLADLYGITV